MHPPRRLHRPECSLATLSPENGSSGRSRPGMIFFTKEAHSFLCNGGTENVLPRGLAPRASAFARRRAELLHFGSKNGAPCRSCTGTVSLEETHAAVIPMTRSKMVAASGIAPNSPRLQRGANLSQLHSLCGPSARYRAAVFHLSGGCSALELRRNALRGSAS